MLKHLVFLDWCTNAYRHRACDECSRLVGLDLITNAYHIRDLGRNLPSGTFTSHRRRGGDITHSGLDYVLCGAITIVLMWR